MQLKKLELLAPAKNKEIGIAAIACGADAVYIAGPEFGAREAAGNSVADIAELADYAHRYGARVYATVNTLLEGDSEYRAAVDLLNQLYNAGVDAALIQDFKLLDMPGLPPIELHASTQAVCRTVEQAKMLESLGFSRIVLERQLSLERIQEIRSAVNCELEFFVHGALCVCYSGECFLSNYLTGRSANRGACAQPCRSHYDLIDGTGKTIVRNKSLLSLKDYRLDNHISELAAAGICSFKIEGRLKGVDYVKNVTRHYRNIIDKFISEHSDEYVKSSFGSITGGFSPNPDITFNRGYTELYIDGKKGDWNSGDATKSLGEYIGKITAIGNRIISVKSNKQLHNGDGLAFVKENGEIEGSRADVVNGNQVQLKDCSILKIGDEVYRNFNIEFEKELEKNMPRRQVAAEISLSNGELVAIAEGNIKVSVAISPAEFPEARNQTLARENIMNQLSKSAGIYGFKVRDISDDMIRFYPASQLNAWRREVAEKLDQLRIDTRTSTPFQRGTDTAPTQPREKQELMRSKYCIRHQLGLCGKKIEEPWRLVNNQTSLYLHFDCRNCEMSVTL